MPPPRKNDLFYHPLLVDKVNNSKRIVNCNSQQLLETSFYRVRSKKPKEVGKYSKRLIVDAISSWVTENKTFSICSWLVIKC